MNRNTVILLVEDDPDTAVAMQRLMSKWGYFVVPADDIEQAVRIAQVIEVHLLITDVGLPDGSGLDLPRRLGSRRPPRAVSLTAWTGLEHESRAAGFDAHLVKPFPLDQLAQLIHHLLTPHRAPDPGSPPRSSN